MPDPSPDTPNPNLADRIDMTRIITAGDGHRSIVFQSGVSDSDRTAAAARLRKLDRHCIFCASTLDLGLFRRSDFVSASVAALSTGLGIIATLSFVPVIPRFVLFHTRHPAKTFS